MENIRIIDSHTHLTGMDSINYLVRSSEKHNFDKLCVMSLQCTGASNIIQNLLCALAKIKYPDKFYAFGGLYHPDDPNKAAARDFYRQAVRLRQMGFDGMKMLEGKPDVRKKTGLPLDSPVYDEYFSYLEKEGIPVTYHVGDPRIFWDEEKAPDWAKINGWTYTDGSFATKDDLYNEINGLLNKFPGLKVTFAHFFFMGEEGIERASEFLDKWPNVNYDITPGIEMYGSFSESPEKWRDFFIKYQDRILFGSDNGLDESLVYIDVSKAFLETSGVFECRGMQIKGIGLERGVLEKIYYKNFERLAGSSPRRINADMVLEECCRLRDIVEKESNFRELLADLERICEEIKISLEQQEC